MQQLRDILYKVHLLSVKGNTDIAITGIQTDSRAVIAGTVFIAVRGDKTDGHDYIDSAVASGAAAVICESMPASLANAVTYVQVSDSHEATAFMAHNFYGEPSLKIKLVGVTGTNGKTTVATLLFNLFTQMGHICGLVSTVQNQVGKEVLPATHTTPDAISLNRLLHDMVQQGCTHVFMECSSHAIHQKRIAALHFTGGLFTNITHDHLDYHKTFEEYIRVKKQFFDMLGSDAFAITNLDDKRGLVMLQNTSAKRYSYSLKTVADFKGKIFDNALTGLVMMVNDTEVHFRLIGEFNAYNLLAVFGAAICLGASSQEVLRVLSMLSGAEGRFDYIISRQRIVGIVDYAHTPDALDNVLATIKKLRKGHEQVITVIGCGGDRDKTKRPIMAKVAAELSTRLIITSDNPRSEEIHQIIADMEAGLGSAGKRKSISIADRKEAIKTAVSFARSEDIILVAGKGHEKYQEIKGTKFPFDDKAVLKEMFELLDK